MLRMMFRGLHLYGVSVNDERPNEGKVGFSAAHVFLILRRLSNERQEMAFVCYGCLQSLCRPPSSAFDEYLPNSAIIYNPVLRLLWCSSQSPLPFLGLFDSDILFCTLGCTISQSMRRKQTGTVFSAHNNMEAGCCSVVQVLPALYVVKLTAHSTDITRVLLHVETYSILGAGRRCCEKRFSKRYSPDLDVFWQAKFSTLVNEA